MTVAIGLAALGSAASPARAQYYGGWIYYYPPVVQPYYAYPPPFYPPFPYPPPPLVGEPGPPPMRRPIAVPPIRRWHRPAPATRARTAFRRLPSRVLPHGLVNPLLGPLPTR